MPEQDLARIAFVTRRFSDLQGLRLACFGALLVVGAVTGTFVPEGFGEPLFSIVVPAQNLMFGLSIVLSGYYERSFGRVPSGRQQHPSLGRKQWDMASGAGLFIVLMGMYADLFIGAWRQGGISLGAAALVASSLWIVWRDWPHRLHHLSGAAAGLAGMIISASVPVTHREFATRFDPTIADVYALTYAMLGLGFLAVGLLDHRLLSLSMAGRSTRRDAAPDQSASRVRAGVAGMCLLITLSYLALAGWPAEPTVLYMSLYLGTSVGMVTVGAIYMAAIGTRNFRAANGEAALRREARLLAQMARLRGEPPREEVETPSQLPDVPMFDLLGHVLLPFAVACGALIDVGARGSGVPSVLALALAASHLRIAVRDWPSRKHYLLGALAGSISGLHFMFVSQQQLIDWAVWFVILVCAAMVAEGLLDLRLSTKLASESPREPDAVTG